jgi:Tfp pilus assembly pilus retraction ATPase PilT
MNALMDSPLATDGLSATSSLSKPGFDDPVRVTRETLDLMLQFCIDNKADDLLLCAGHPWAVIWSEQVVLIGQRMLYPEELESLLNEMTSNTNASLQVMRADPIDFAYTLRYGSDRRQTKRFRCNATGCLGLQGQSGLEIVLRPVGKIPPTPQELGLPSYIIDNIPDKTGIVLLTGPTGSGKTTALDSMIRHFATHPVGRHILTYYAPIENDLLAIPGRTGVIAQSEVGLPGYGAHLTEFEEATRNSLRRHPMVIVYGEARDKETIAGAVLSAMTGHITFTTTHTPNVHMTIPRMSDAFSGSDRTRISNGLIDNTRLIFHQRLLKTPSLIGRAPVRSALAMTREIRSDLLRTPIDLLPAAILELTNSEGIGLLDDALEQHRKGLIHDDEMYQLEAELKAEVV